MNNNLSIDLASQEKRDNLVNQIEKWNQIEQAVFIVDNIKHLSLSLIKFMSAICNDLVKIKTLNSNQDDNLNKSNASQYSSILEEQANDLSNFCSMTHLVLNLNLIIFKFRLFSNTQR